MGKAVKSVTKAVTKTVQKAVKATGTAAKSFATAGFDGVKSLAKGDLGGVADAATRAASGGTISLGDKGLLNANMTNKPKEASAAATTANTDLQTDGLLQYVSDLRSRKSRRSRASTNNTNGANSTDPNKLSGTTALGV